MHKVMFDFSLIPDMASFYSIFVNKFSLDDKFGHNLDALWDAITGEIDLPVAIEFTHFDERCKRRFASLILLFEDAEEELEGELHFQY